MIDHAERIAPDDHEQAWNGPSESKQPSWLSQHTRLAAGFALAMMLGGLAGAATTAFVSQPPTPAPAKATNPNLAMQQSLARLENEVASVKAGIAAAQRSTGAQFGKLSERIDRAEKAQAEPGRSSARLSRASTGSSTRCRKPACCRRRLGPWTLPARSRWRRPSRPSRSRRSMPRSSRSRTPRPTPSLMPSRAGGRLASA